MVDITKSLNGVRTQWRDASRTHLLSLSTWFQAVLAGAAMTAEAAGVSGPGRLVVFRSTLNEVASGERCESCDLKHSEFRPQLASVVFAGVRNQVKLTTEAGTSEEARLSEVWVTAVELWSELRSVLLVTNQHSQALNFVVDVDTTSLIAYPDEGCPEDDMLGSFLHLLTLDELNAKLEDLDNLIPTDDVAAAELGRERIYDLLTAYELGEPVTMHSEEELCGICFDEDDFDEDGDGEDDEDDDGPGGGDDVVGDLETEIDILLNK